MPFRSLLAELVANAPGARGAIFCDYEGENVDLAVADPQPPRCGPLSNYDLKVCGAQFAAVWLLLQERNRNQGAGSLCELRVRAERGTLLCRSVRDGYYLTLLLSPGPSATTAGLALARTATRFAEEM